MNSEKVGGWHRWGEGDSDELHFWPQYTRVLSLIATFVIMPFDTRLIIPKTRGEICWSILVCQESYKSCDWLPIIGNRRDRRELLLKDFQRHFIYCQNTDSILPYRKWQSRIFVYFYSRASKSFFYMHQIQVEWNLWFVFFEDPKVIIIYFDQK